MLSYNQIKIGKYIVWNSEPYQVLDTHVFRKQQRKPVNAVKLKNLITGKVIERSFHQSEKAEEAAIETKQAKYLYANKGQYWFADPKDLSRRFQIDGSVLSDRINFIKPNSAVTILCFNDKIIGLEWPIKVDLLVKEAPPTTRGNTISGGIKQVTLETGAVVNVPMFINAGDLIRVNTATGQYVERVN